MDVQILNAILRNFSAGAFAGLLQMTAVVLATPLVLLLMRPSAIAFLSSNFHLGLIVPSTRFQSTMLTGSYLILSLGAALTENRYLDATTMHVRYIAHRKRGSKPTLTMALMLLLFCSGTALFVMLALQVPPKFLFDLGHYFGWSAFPMIWPGTLSVGAAFFGANAFACLKALQW